MEVVGLANSQHSWKLIIRQFTFLAASLCEECSTKQDSNIRTKTEKYLNVNHFPKLNLLFISAYNPYNFFSRFFRWVVDGREKYIKAFMALPVKGRKSKSFNPLQIKLFQGQTLKENSLFCTQLHCGHDNKAFKLF